VAAHITTGDIQSWLESTKLSVSSIDPSLEAQVTGEVFGRLSTQFGQFVPLWVDPTTTPQIVRQIIAMIYAGWLYDRSYSEVETNEARVSYGAVLRTWAATLITDILSGGVIIAETEPGGPATAPVFYPTDASSTYDAWVNNTDLNDQSLGPAKFGMGMVF
jgi:hypothetical protein